MGGLFGCRGQEVCYLRQVPESARGRPATATEWRAAAYRHLWSALSLAHATEALLHELLNLGLESATAFRWQIETARGHPNASIACGRCRSGAGGRWGELSCARIIARIWSSLGGSLPAAG